MTSINNEQILITFEELKHLEIADVALCIDKYQALSICGKSSAPAPEIYGVWVNKLFKAYDISDFKDEDWYQILGYLEKILDEFIQKCHPATNTDSTSKHLNQWWSDTMELLQWLQTIIHKLDKRILALILAFGLEIIIKTFKITHKRNNQLILTIQKQLLHMLTNHMLKMDLHNAEDFKVLNKVLTSLCDVGSLISSSDIKVSIETWRIAAKISGKCSDSYTDIDNSDKEVIKDLRHNWTEKPITGIVMELQKLFNYFLEDGTSLNNENFLKVAQFYLKLVKIVIKNTLTFTVVKEFFEVYTIFLHQLKERKTSQLIDSIQEDLYEILAFVHQDVAVENHLCQHLLDDNRKLLSCDLILEYMRICFDKDRKHFPDVQFSNRVFNILFEGPLIFIDDEKYPKVVMYFAALTVKDITSQLHMLWCRNVMESPWTKAYVSCEILRTYYGYIFKSSNEKAKICLEFWIECWQKYNFSSCTSAAFQHQRFLIEMIIKTVLNHVSPDNIEQCFAKSTYAEIILLKCGKDNVKLLCNLNTNLANNLKKIQDMNLLRSEYTELLNLMDIWCCHPQYVNVCAVRNDLTKSFLKLFSLPLVEMKNFRDLFSRCFCVFKILNDTQTDNIIFKCLRDNLNKTKAIVGAFMLDYLSKRSPQSQLLLHTLQTPEVEKLQRYLETAAAKTVPSVTEDLKMFQDLYIKSLNKSNKSIFEDVHINKRPRVADNSDSIDYKVVLNEMLQHSQQILNTTMVFDSKDYELLNCIKHNIEKCLIK